MILTSILCMSMYAAPASALMPHALLALQSTPTRSGTTTLPAGTQPTRSGGSATTTPAPAGVNRSTVTITPTVAPPTPLAPYRELYALAWRPVPAGCNFVTQMIRLEGSFHPGFLTSSLVSLPSASAVAAQSRAVPAGRAAIQWWRYSNSLFYPDPLGSVGTTPSAPAFPLPWDAAAVNSVGTEWAAWLQQYKNAGGRLDLLIGDCERWGMFTSWSLSNGQIQRIASDSRASQPYFGAPALTTMLAGVNINAVKSYTQTTDYLKWDAAMGTLTAAAMKKSVWDPAVAQFPSLRGSNYGGTNSLVSPAPDLNGHPVPANNVVGTASSPVAYGEMEGIAQSWFIDSADPTKLSKTGSVRLTRTPWNAFLLDVQRGRACKRSAPALPLHTWIALQSWRGRVAGFVPYPSDLRYHDEMIRHYALLGTETFLYWNPDPVPGDPQMNFSEADRTAGATRLNGVLADLNTRLDGVIVNVATTAALRFDSKIVTSGAQRRDGKWIWRTTVDPTVRRIRDQTTGAIANLDATGVGRWDITDTNVAPRFAVDAAVSSLVVGVDTTR